MRTILTALLAMSVTASASAQQAPTAAAPGSASSTTSTATPSVIATGSAPSAPPLGGSYLLPNGGTAMLPLGSNGCNCCLGKHQRGSWCHVLLAWATYCPKNRIGIIQECNTCKYHGALPFYTFFGRGCQEGNGAHATLPKDTSCHCHHGCAKCAGNGCK